MLTYGQRYFKDYYQKNKVHIKEIRAKYVTKNKKKILERLKKYREEHKEYFRDYKKARSKTPEGKLKIKKHCQKRRALMKNSVFDLTSKEIEKIFKRDESCVYCNSIKNLTLDHIIPISKGGNTSFNNMVIACKACNSSKGNKEVFSWCTAKNQKVPSIVLSLLSSK